MLCGYFSLIRAIWIGDEHGRTSVQPAAGSSKSDRTMAGQHLAYRSGNF